MSGLSVIYANYILVNANWNSNFEHVTQLQARTFSAGDTESLLALSVLPRAFVSLCEKTCVKARTSSEAEQHTEPEPPTATLPEFAVYARL